MKNEPECHMDFLQKVHVADLTACGPLIFRRVTCY